MAEARANPRRTRSQWKPGPAGASRDNDPVQARLVAFGELEIQGERFNHDVVIEAGHLRRRRKGPSKSRRAEFGHTPLTSAEELPWGGELMIIGTGAEGALPVTSDVYEEATRRGVRVRALPTRDACRLLEKLERQDVYAVLHVTC